MKLPSEVVTRNKIRDTAICRLYAQDNKTQEEIAKQFGISQTRVGVILYRNRAILNFDKNFERIKQFNRLKRQIIKKGDSNKDVADLEELLLKIMEDKQPLIDNSTHLHLTNLHGEQLINEARRRGIALPSEIERRITSTGRTE